VACAGLIGGALDVVEGETWARTSPGHSQVRRGPSPAGLHRTRDPNPP